MLSRLTCRQSVWSLAECCTVKRATCAAPPPGCTPTNWSLAPDSPTWGFCACSFCRVSRTDVAICASCRTSSVFWLLRRRDAHTVSKLAPAYGYTMLMPPSLLQLTCRGRTTCWALLRDDRRARSSLNTCAGATAVAATPHHGADATNLV